jgi:thymidylate synthase, flavin-dependent
MGCDTSSPIYLVDYTKPDVAIEAMSKCYGKKCTLDSLVKACKSGHWSLLEHIHVSMDVLCSQKVLAQLSRHRHFSFTVQSTRGSNIVANGFYNGFDKETAMMNQAYDTIAVMFNNLLTKGVSVEQASYILTLGVKVRLSMSGNLRCWLEYLKQRLCKRASKEHQEIARAIYHRLHVLYPSLCNLDMLGMCENCKELSCDFTSHKKKQKEPVRKELQ